MKPCIILALDVDNPKKAKYFVNKLYPRVKIFKVGSQLFTAAGPEIVRFINRKGARVFLDLKFFDIPNTVANAVRMAVRLKVAMLTLHILGGKEMISQAALAVKEEAMRLKIKKPLLIGVTVLTSKEADFSEVLKLAKTGLGSGLDGVVCSAQEAALLRKRIRNKFVIVTPGIRAEKAASDDQKRAASAQQAIKAGSNYLVIGRPILKSADPVAAAMKFLAAVS